MTVGIIKVEMGDTIEVGGQRFVLVEMTQKMDKPATVVFKQPVEIMREAGRG